MKKYFKYVSMSVLSSVGLSLYILADTYFIALGMEETGLASLNLALPLFSLISALGIMIGMGAATLFALKYEKRIFTHALAMALGFGLIFLVCGLFFAEEITMMLGATGALLAPSTDYARLILLFAPAFLLNNLLLAFVRNDGAPRLAMLAMLTSSFSNIILDYIFIFPCGLGMFGAALATGIAPCLSILLLLRHCLSTRCGFSPVRSKPNAGLALSIALSGSPSMITELSSAILLLIFNTRLLSLGGTTAVAAYGVIANLALIVCAVFTGIGQGAQPLLSRRLQKNDMPGAKRYLKYSIICALSFSLIFLLGGQFGAERLAGIFCRDDNEGLIAAASEGIRIYFTAFPFIAYNIISTAFLAAVGRAKPSLMLQLLRSFVFLVPAVMLLSSGFGVQGVWASVPLCEVSCAVFVFIVLNRATKEAS